MSWSIRDPPSPVSTPPSEPRSAWPFHPIPREMDRLDLRPAVAPDAPTPEASPRYVSAFLAGLTKPPTPSLPRIVTLNLVGQDQWSENPLRIKSTFTIVGEPDNQSLRSPACGMGWSFHLDLSPILERTTKNENSTARVTPRVIPMYASLQSGLQGFPPVSFSIRASFRDKNCVLAVLENDWYEDLSPQEITIPLGCCDIPLPLGEVFIDLVVTLSFWDSVGSSEVPRSISVPISKAIRATLDGEFPININFMLSSRKRGKKSACKRRPIYASRSILKGRSSFLDSHMKESHVGDDPSTSTYEYPYDEDSDLESDSDTDHLCNVFDRSPSSLIEAPPRPLFPTSSPDLDTAQTGPPESPKVPSSLRKPIPPAYGTDDDSVDSSAKNDCQITNVFVQDKVPASSPQLVLINDIAFKTFRAFIIYMYIKEVSFVPLKSSGGRSYSAGDACSPKSMYRLAVKAGHETLKKHAFENLRSQLMPSNIIAEIFSKFTTDYPEIFEMELKVLLNHFTNPSVQDEWERMIDMVANGRLPHGADMLKKVTRALRT
ncbi:hypothetical protein IW261DRAFT_1470000 [Armillaria novae-zelandiae]|uniref:BTB domain-containing protein n=1 Tax=Armillaria novae-zelandiae TaxID=153914 RepID=A0AA39PBP2_9AGAR|nr:hypothetical protein IW261DRAFT_1470000 [Armillaria novae-zelandiae]